MREVAHADVVVVGLGTIGSMAAWQLASRGLRVVGVEQFGVGHTRGSYAGESRLFRVVVHEGARYVPTLLRARELWAELEAAADRELLIRCGCLTIGEPQLPSLQRATEAARMHDLPHEVLDAAELRARFPQHQVSDDVVAIHDPHGGGLRPEAAVLSAAELARARGATILEGEPVVAVEERGAGIVVRTESAEILADRAVITAGSWASRLCPEIGDLAEVRPVDLTWFAARRIERFLPEVFPVFVRDQGPVHMYGAPTYDGYSVKVGLGPYWSRADSPDRLPEPTREHLTSVGRHATEFLPDLFAEPVRHSMHHDLYTATGLPVIDWVADGRVLLMAAFSGRGAKFAPAYGRLAADLLTGTATDLYDPGCSLAAHRATITS